MLQPAHTRAKNGFAAVRVEPRTDLATARTAEIAAPIPPRAAARSLDIAARFGQSALVSERADANEIGSAGHHAITAPVARRVQRTIALDALCRTIVLLSMLWYIWELTTASDVFIDLRGLAWAVALWQGAALIVEGRALRSPPGSRRSARKSVALVALFALPRLVLLLPVALETLHRSPGRVNYPTASVVITVILTGVALAGMAIALMTYAGLARST